MRFLFCFLITLQNAFAGVSAFDYLNELRQLAGMQPFELHSQLQLSAQRHADYLAINHGWGHSEVAGRPGFSGAVPEERMLSAGYNNRHGSENVSTHLGKVSAKKSVDGLMSAIYHRFAFLSFDHDQLGIGYASDKNFHSFVYNMGNSQKESLCALPEKNEVPGYYLYQICSREQKKLLRETYRSVQDKVRRANPALVVWPYDGAVQVNPGFYEEAPDPLPGIDVSGYPVSVQFNPAKFSSQAPRVSRFELFRASDNKKIELAAYFNKNSDINHKFSALEHAIFPLNRLEWNTLYRAEMDFMDDQDASHQVSWSFRTTDFKLPRYELFGGETITSAGQPFVVYMHPLSSRDAAAEYTLSYSGFNAVNVSIFDPHTLIIETDGNSGEAVFDFHERKFRIVK